MRLWRDEGGAALPLALMALVVLGALSSALLTIGGSEVQIAGNHLRGTQAYFLAEAGLEDAFNSFRTTPGNLSPATAVTTLTNVPGLSGPGTTLAAYGGYTVQYQSAGASTVLVVATGYTGTSANRSAENALKALITNGFVSDDAIRTNGDLNSTGSMLQVAGTCGSAHTNEDFDVSGGATPTFSEGVTATATADSPGTGGQARKTVPSIRASDFLAEAKKSRPASQIFSYKSDGRVYDGNDNLVFTYSAGPPKVDTYRGWEYEHGRWELESASDATGATYYFETDVKLEGGALQATILATGNIEVSGNVTLTPHLTDTLLVADKDIDLNGTSGSTATGLIAAHEQVEITGNVSITGFILAEDAAATSRTVTANTFGGSVTVTYDCNARPPIKGPVQFIAWGL